MALYVPVDMVFDALQTQKYYRESPYWNNYHLSNAKNITSTYSQIDDDLLPITGTYLAEGLIKIALHSNNSKDNNFGYEAGFNEF